MSRVDRQRDAWAEFLSDFGEEFGAAVTLVYNPPRRGTAEQCFRKLPDGRRVPIPTPGVPPRNGVRRLAEIEVIPINVVHRDLDRLHRTIDRKLFGSKFNLLPFKKRTNFIGIIEHAESNIHVHLVWRVPPSRVDKFVEILPSTWSTMVPGGSVRIVPAADLGWAKYVVKDFVGWGRLREGAKSYAKALANDILR